MNIWYLVASPLCFLSLHVSGQTLRTYQVFECMTRESGRSEHEQASERVASFMAKANLFFRMFGD